MCAANAAMYLMLVFNVGSVERVVEHCSRQACEASRQLVLRDSARFAATHRTEPRKPSSVVCVRK